MGRGMGFWPPFLGAGVRVRHISKDWRSATVSMPLRFYNKNLFGTHFGGSLYSMTDPFFAMLILKNLGSDYWVWDRAAHIDYVKPGKGRVTAVFTIDDEMIGQIQQATKSGEKHLQTLVVDIKDADDDLVARVRKTIYIRRKY